MELYDIKLEDVNKISNIIKENNIRSSLFSSYNLYALRNKYHTKIAYKDDILYLKQNNRQMKEQYVNLFPIGGKDLKSSIQFLMDNQSVTQKHFILWGLTDEMVKKLNELFPNLFIFEEIENWSDYIYDREKLLKCKRMKKSKKFTNQYQNKYIVEEIGALNIKEIIEFQHKWMKDNADSNDDIGSLNFEHQSIIESLKNWEKMPLKGYCIKIEENIIAFSYGFMQTSDCFTLHVIKSDKTIKGLTLFCLQYLIQNVRTQYINFEEDIGIEGLRTFKTRLNPEFMLKKYKARRK